MRRNFQFHNHNHAFTQSLRSCCSLTVSMIYNLGESERRGRAYIEKNTFAVVLEGFASPGGRQ